MNKVIAEILKRFGLTIAPTAPGVQLAARYGRLFHILTLAEASDPLAWHTTIEAAGDIQFEPTDEQPFNRTTNHFYAELCDGVDYWLTLEAGKLVYGAYHHGVRDSLMLECKIKHLELAECRVDLEIIRENYLLVKLFEHFDVPKRHLDYTDPHVVYLLENNRLINMLSYVKTYFGDRLASSLSAPRSMLYSQFGLVVEWTESLPTVIMPGPVNYRHQHYVEHNGDWYCGLEVVEDRLHVLSKDGLSYRGLPGMSYNMYQLKHSGWSIRISAPAKAVRSYLMMNKRFNDIDYPDDNMSDIYLLGIVERNLMTRALEIYSGRVAPMTWRDLAIKLKETM